MQIGSEWLGVILPSDKPQAHHLGLRAPSNLFSPNIHCPRAQGYFPMCFKCFKFQCSAVFDRKPRCFHKNSSYWTFLPMFCLVWLRKATLPACSSLKIQQRRISQPAILPDQKASLADQKVARYTFARGVFSAFKVIMNKDEQNVCFGGKLHQE